MGDQAAALRQRILEVATPLFLARGYSTVTMDEIAAELGISIIPKVDPNLKVGDGALLRSVLTEIIQNSHGKRPLHASLFRQVQSENLPAFEPLMSPSGLSAELSSHPLVQIYGHEEILGRHAGVESRHQGALRSGGHQFRVPDSNPLREAGFGMEVVARDAVSDAVAGTVRPPCGFLCALQF